jgi:transforming growth factor-beta-induced protein
MNGKIFKSLIMNVLKNNFFSFLIVLALADLAGNATAQTTKEVLLGDARFSILAEALKKADLLEVFAEEKSITLFAPTNEAFRDFLDKMSVASIDDLSAEQLKPILMFHVAAYKIPSSGLYPGTITTLNKNAGLSVKVENDRVVLNNETGIKTKDIQTSNGLIHIIEKVMIPHIRSNKESGSGHC